MLTIVFKTYKKAIFPRKTRKRNKKNRLHALSAIYRGSHPQLTHPYSTPDLIQSGVTMCHGGSRARDVTSQLKSSDMRSSVLEILNFVQIRQDSSAVFVGSLSRLNIYSNSVHLIWKFLIASMVFKIMKCFVI